MHNVYLRVGLSRDNFHIRLGSHLFPFSMSKKSSPPNRNEINNSHLGFEVRLWHIHTSYTFYPAYFTYICWHAVMIFRLKCCSTLYTAAKWQQRLVFLHLIPLLYIIYEYLCNMYVWIELYFIWIYMLNRKNMRKRKKKGMTIWRYWKKNKK